MKFMCADAKTYRPRIICEGVGCVVFVSGVRVRVCVKERREECSARECEGTGVCVANSKAAHTYTYKHTHPLSL